MLRLTLGGTVEERAYDAANFAEFLVDAGEFDEAKQFMRDKTPSIKDSLGRTTAPCWTSRRTTGEASLLIQMH